MGSGVGQGVGSASSTSTTTTSAPAARRPAHSKASRSGSARWPSSRPRSIWPPGAAIPALYVAERAGVVRRIEITTRTNGAVSFRLERGSVLDIGSEVITDGERGLLGIVFSRDGRKLYFAFTGTDGNQHLDEVAMDGEEADMSTRRTADGRSRLRVEPQRRRPRRRPGRLPLLRDGRRWRRWRSGGHGPEPRRPARCAAADRPRGGQRRRSAVRRPRRQPVQERRRGAGGVGLRAAQPVAVQLRPGHGRPLDRRRRAGRLRGDRPASSGLRWRSGRQPRLERDGRRRAVRGRPGAARPCPSDLRPTAGTAAGAR